VTTPPIVFVRFLLPSVGFYRVRLCAFLRWKHDRRTSVAVQLKRGVWEIRTKPRVRRTKHHKHNDISRRLSERMIYDARAAVVVGLELRRHRANRSATVATRRRRRPYRFIIPSSDSRPFPSSPLPT